MVINLLTISGIVVPALLLTALLRRFVELPWVAVFAFLGLTLLFIGKPLVTSSVPVPLDEVMTGYPWKGVVGPVQPRNPLTNDTVKLFLPWMHVAREDLFSRRFPLWNRYSFSGYPLLGNGESAPFSPFFLLTLFVPLPDQLVAMAGLKLFVAAIFSYLFLRRFSSSAAAAAGAVVYAFCVYQTVYLFYSATAVSELLPVAAFAVAECIEKQRRRDFVLLAIAVAVLLAAGHPESVLHAALACAVVTLVSWRSLSAKGTAFVIAAAATGALVAAPLWLPVAQEVASSSRLDQIVAAGRKMNLPYQTAAIFAFLSPDAFGNPVRGTWQWLYNYATVASSYVGLLPLAAVLSSIAGVRRSARERAFSAAAIVSILIAFVWTPIGRFGNALPLLSITANEKLRFVAAFFAAAALACVIERIRGRRADLVDGIAAATVLAAFVWLWEEKRGVTLEAVAWIGPVVAVFAALAIFQRENVARIAIPTLLFAELAIINWGFNAPVSRRYFAPELPIMQAMKRAAPSEPFRVAALDWTLIPNWSALYGVEDIRGSDPMAWGPYVRFLARFTREDPGADVRRVISTNRDEIRFLNVRFFLAPPGSLIAGEWKEIYSGADGDLYEQKRPIPRFFVPAELLPSGALSRISDFGSQTAVEGVARARPNGKSSALWYSPYGPQRFRLSVDSAEGTFVASSQPAVDGWVVEVNGKEVEISKVNGAFLGFRVPPGHSSAVVRYRPGAFYRGLLLAFLGVVVLAFAGRGKANGRGVQEHLRGVEYGPGGGG